MALMRNKRGIIFGVANNKSIAWGVAQELKAAGAELAFTYLSEVTESRVRKLAAEIGSDFVLPCDVGKEEELAAVFAALAAQWGKIDFVVHSLAFADREELRNPFSQTTLAGFTLAMEVSVYSLINIVKQALPLLNPGGSMVTMTYLGSTRAVPSYGVMGVAKAGLEASVRYLAEELGPQGVRINAISAGPIKTLAASAVADFNKKIKITETFAPLRRTVSQNEVGKAAVYLLSDLSSGVTGEVHFVDGGFNCVVSA